jgi:quercetin dioxygenase-like cupin family protein
MDWKVQHIADLKGATSAEGDVSVYPVIDFGEVSALHASVWDLRAGREDPETAHFEDRILYVIQGQAISRAADQETIVRPGSIIYVRGDVPHKFVNIEQDLRVLVFFSLWKPFKRRHWSIDGVEISLHRRTPVEACLDILAGKLSLAVETLNSDDRELQMSACYFLAEHATHGDPDVIAALTSKLEDNRAVDECISLNEGYCGSDYYVSACAAEALRALGGPVTRRDVPENFHEFWSPRLLEIRGDYLVLSQKTLKPYGIQIIPASEPQSKRSEVVSGMIPFSDK